jgi:flavin-binding protein dodecin
LVRGAATWGIADPKPVRERAGFLVSGAWHDGSPGTGSIPGGAHVGVIIIREMVGTSPQSWSDAARQAVATASKTVRNIQSVEVVKSSAVVQDGEIVEYRVELKIGFEYEG